MFRLWKWYQNSLSVHPIKTQVISSGLIWGFGDIAAQTITHSTAQESEQIQAQVHCRMVFNNTIPCASGGEPVPFKSFSIFREKGEDEKLKINWRRVGTTSLFGFGFVGPVGHLWYEGLDRYIRSRLLLQPKSFRFVASKVAIDGFLFGPLDLLAFFTYMGFSAGKSFPQIKEDVKRDFLPAFVLEGGVWPIVQVVNFRFIPVRYQLLYVNFFCLLDSSFLSWLEQQQDAPWKQWLKSLVHVSKQNGEER